MKKLFLAFALLLCAAGFYSCGGTQSVTSGVEDRAGVCVSADSEYPIVVTIDGQAYETRTLKDIAYKSRRDIKKTTKFALPTIPGRHQVEISRNGETIYSKEVMISTGETKIIRL